MSYVTFNSRSAQPEPPHSGEMTDVVFVTRPDLRGFGLYYLLFPIAICISVITYFLPADTSTKIGVWGLAVYFGIGFQAILLYQ